MIQELTKTHKQIKLKKKSAHKRITSPKNMRVNSIERNQSLPTRPNERGLQNQRVHSKNAIVCPEEDKIVNKKMNLHQLSFEELRYKPEFNISIFKFQQEQIEGWERLTLNKDLSKIKSKISNFDTELERVNQIYNKNEQSMNTYLNVQCELMSLKQKVRFSNINYQ